MKYLKYLSLGSLILLGSATASAQNPIQSATGTIGVYTVDSEGIRVCIATTPPLPSDPPVACLYSTTPNYTEMSNLLRTAFFSETTCAVFWRGTDAFGNLKIILVSCSK